MTTPSAAGKRAPVQRDWVSKTLAGTLLGLALALSASGILSDLSKPMPLPVRGQLAMWLVPPVWLCTLGFVYFFSSGRRAWLWLGAANVVVGLAWWALRTSIR